MRTALVLAMSLLSLNAAAAPTPGITGLWQTPDRGAVIAVAPCGNGVCGRIVGIFLDRASDPMPVDYRGVSQCGLTLITDARQVRPNLWKGHITDPRNGHNFGAELHLDEHGNLALRGFIGIPLLGETQTWVPYPNKPPLDCRIPLDSHG